MVEETDWDMKITEECLRKLKLATTFEQAMYASLSLSLARSLSPRSLPSYRGIHLSACVALSEQGCGDDHDEPEENVDQPERRVPFACL